MLSAPEALVLDFLDWVGAEPRPYGEVMEVWRTSCPRLTVWEDARDEGFVARAAGPKGAVIELTAKGREFIARTRRTA